jgi:hypothetical protein
MTFQKVFLFVALFAAPADSVLKVASSAPNAVAKVIGLLNEMKAQIEKEGAEDADMFEKLGCWCSTNKEEKTAAVAAAQTTITDLNAAIPEAAAKAAQCEVDIKQLNKEIKANTAALEEATGIREKEEDEYRTSEKDMISSLASLKSAIGVMSKVQLNQQGVAALPQESLAQVQAILDKHMKHLSFLQGPATAMLQQNAKGKNRAPSSQIFGILKGMKETFETNLASAKTEEELAIQQFIELKKAKTSEVAAAEDLVETKTVELAKAKEINAHGKEDLADAREQLSADNEFLSNLNLKCDNAEKEYNDRVKVRNEELVAVAETIGILNDDDAKDQFNKAGFGTFLQISSKSSKREKAAQMLSKAGKELHKPALITLSMSMKLHGFEEVIANIDKMKAALKDEQAEEVKQKDYCISEFNENEKNVAEKSTMKTDLETRIADDTTEIEELTEAINVLKAQIAETNKEMTKASQLREAANHEFQVTIQDQRATQAILKKALDRLKSFYGFVQQGQEPPTQGTYKKSAGSSGVMTMIETLVEESAQLEADAMKGEADAQAAYESFMKDSTAANDAASKDVVNKSQRSAKADADMIQASNDLKATITDLLTLGEYNQALHKKCDFLVKNFDLRQQSRVQEMEALAQAKAIFQGAK